LPEERIQDFLAVSEIRALEPCEGFGEIHQSATRGQSEDAQRSGNIKPLAERHSSAFTLIDQNQIGVQGQRERDRRPFSGAQRLECGVVNRVN
jgi:hypothetical protein